MVDALGGVEVCSPTPLEDAELAAMADSISDHVMTEIGEWFEQEGDDE